LLQSHGACKPHFLIAGQSSNWAVFQRQSVPLALPGAGAPAPGSWQLQEVASREQSIGETNGWKPAERPPF